jgi:phosphate-selective porin OprO/OprP
MFRSVPCVLAVAACSTTPYPAFGKDGVSVDEQGIKASAMDGDLTVRLGGKLHLDALAVDDGNDDYSDAAVRRARINLRIEYQDVLTLRAEREFAGSRGWRNLYAQLRPIKGTLLQAGQFNVPFSLEDMQSTNTIPFPERSLAAALTSEFAVGVQAGYSGERFTVRAGWFGDALDTPTGPAPSLGRGLVGRATVLAIDSGQTKLHFGLGLERRSFRSGDAVRFVAEAGSTFGPRILRTLQLSNLDRRETYNAEVAMLNGNFALQSQYIEQHVRQISGRKRRLTGGYAQASWLLTGQPYRYSRSAGIPIGPDIGRRKTAVELSGRISWLDAENATIDGGIARSIEVSAGLYLGRNFRLLISGAQSRYREQIGDPTRQAYVAATRAQIAF